jgi:pyruvate,water dikinase
MHIEFSVPRMYSHQETEELRLALEQCRYMEEPLPEAMSGEGMLCRGLAASPGIACGPVFFWNEGIPFDQIPQGCIVVARMTRPEIVMCLDRVAGIVTDIGGRLCHAAIVALERGVPCVVGTRNATEVLTPGMRIRVDGHTGNVSAE